MLVTKEDNPIVGTRKVTCLVGEAIPERSFKLICCESDSLFTAL